MSRSFVFPQKINRERGVGGSRVKLLNTKCDFILTPRDITRGLRPGGPLDKLEMAVARVAIQPIMLQHGDIAASTAVSQKGIQRREPINVQYVEYSCACPIFI